ncbi:hypothetical protein FRC03_001866 [Tulasnella sp. 419]|nr:hypothetical protein FRC03_001866 [Tulasnella sp. 419]
METDSTPSVTNEDTDMSESGYDGELSDFAPSLPWRGPTEESKPSRTPSINSYHSSMDGYLVGGLHVAEESPSTDYRQFRDVQGRVYNNMNLTYRLPADIEEHDRLTKQHIMICNYIKGLYPAKDIVEYLLRPGQEERPTVLDAGAGSGAWLIDMANKFPETDFVGLDLVPPKLGDRVLPENCRYEIDDANLSMTHWVNAFDIVHVRALDDGIHDFEYFLYNVAQTIKPGGLLIIGGGSRMIYDENDEPRPDVEEGQPGFSWVQKFFLTVFVDYAPGGRRAGKHWKWADWLNDNPNYEDVVSWLMPLPIGNWKQASSAEEFYANEINRRNLIDICKNYAPILVAEGYPKDVVDRWATGIEKELTELKVHSFSKWKWTWCRRTSNEWIPSPKDKSGGVSEHITSDNQG